MWKWLLIFPALIVLILLWGAVSYLYLRSVHRKLPPGGPLPFSDLNLNKEEAMPQSDSQSSPETSPQ